MKWYFCIESVGVKKFFKYIQAAVASCRQNTSLEPICIMYEYGKPFSSEVTDFLKKYGVKIIQGEALVYKEAIKQKDLIKVRLSHATSGAYLRYEIPLIEKEDEFVLYTDCDIVFRKEITLNDVKPRFLACAPEFEISNYGYFNSGIMVMSMAGLRATLNDLIVSSLARMRAGFCIGSDQGDLNGFYHMEWSRLDVSYNWKPYWGVNEDARIIHFHGPKPDDWYYIMNGQKNDPLALRMILLNQDAYRHYIIEFLHYLNLSGAEWHPELF